MILVGLILTVTAKPHREPTLLPWLTRGGGGRSRVRPTRIGPNDSPLVQEPTLSPLCRTKPKGKGPTLREKEKADRKEGDEGRLRYGCSRGKTDSFVLSWDRWLYCCLHTPDPCKHPFNPSLTLRPSFYEGYTREQSFRSVLPFGLVGKYENLSSLCTTSPTSVY